MPLSKFVVDLPTDPAAAAGTEAPLDDEDASPIVAAADRGVVERLESELRAGIAARASNEMSESRALKRAFLAFDSDASGAIDFREFTRALERFGLHTQDSGRNGAGGLSNSVAKALFDRFDKDGSGLLEYQEFEQALLQPARPHPPSLIQKPRLRS